MDNNKEKDDLYLFADDQEIEKLPPQLVKVMYIGQDHGVKNYLQQLIEQSSLESLKISFSDHTDVDQAAQSITAKNDYAVIIIEIDGQNTKELSLIKQIRENLRNHLVRLILLISAEIQLDENFLVEYDVNYFHNKINLEFPKLKTYFLLALQNYKHLNSLVSEKKQLESISEAGARFIPRTFLMNLKRENITQVSLGDFVEKQMTTLFLDIRAFSTMMEQMTPLDGFLLINNYLSYLEPYIIGNHGFIDKYFGDGIMALFDQCEDAFNASIQVFEGLKNFNHARGMAGKLPVHIGIGINTGELIMGTVGFYDRMDCTVIGDAVNVSSRLQELIKEMSVEIMVTQASLDAIPDLTKYDYRFLGNVPIRGKKQRCNIYEIFSIDNPTIKKLKLKTKQDFESAAADFSRGLYLKAKEKFEKVIEINSVDFAAKYFLKKILEKGKLE